MSAKKRTPRTAAEVKAEIAKLKELKPKVRRFTAFNDDNHEAIDSQIKVLEESMGDDAVYARWGEEDDHHAQGAALEVLSWRDGDEPEAPSVGWEELT